jgi:RNA polymerase sigma-70 factor (ECF subfamily)
MRNPVPSRAAAELQRHRSHLLRFALLQLRDTAAAEDAVQETLLAALQSPFDGRSSVRTWLIGILKHKIVDQVRRRLRDAPPPASAELAADDLEALFGQDGHYAKPPGDWHDPDQALQERRFFEALERCLQALPRATSRAFVMREVLGMETPEICKELGVSATNCGVLLYRARMALRGCLEKNWFSVERS